MTCWAVLATGPSMTAEVAGAVRGRCKVMAISDAHRLAPWADAMASTDKAWWREHPEALEFEGRKFTTAVVEGVEKVEFEGPITTGSNSGLLGCHAAIKLGATKLLLCGFDLRGSHFFGAHPAPLKNTSASRFEAFKLQFKYFRPRGVEIVNCTPNSALDAYPRGDLLASLA